MWRVLEGAVLRIAAALESMAAAAEVARTVAREQRERDALEAAALVKLQSTIEGLTRSVGDHVQECHAWQGSLISEIRAWQDGVTKQLFDTDAAAQQKKPRVM